MLVESQDSYISCLCKHFNGLYPLGAVLKNKDGGWGLLVLLLVCFLQIFNFNVVIVPFMYSVIWLQKYLNYEILFSDNIAFMLFNYSLCCI